MKIKYLILLSFIISIFLAPKDTLACVAFNYGDGLYFDSTCAIKYNWPTDDWSLLGECACGVDPKSPYWLKGVFTCDQKNDVAYRYMTTNSCPTTDDTMNGKKCEIKCGNNCDWGWWDGIVKNGGGIWRWDASQDGCGECNGKIQTTIDFGNGNVQTPNTCESACGADSYCDEKAPWGTTSSVCCSDSCASRADGGIYWRSGYGDYLCDDFGKSVLGWLYAAEYTGKIQYTGSGYDALSTGTSWVECNGDGVQERTGDGWTEPRFTKYTVSGYQYICGIEDTLKDSWYMCCGDNVNCAPGDGVKVPGTGVCAQYQDGYVYCPASPQIKSGGGKSFICCSNKNWYECTGGTCCCNDSNCPLKDSNGDGTEDLRGTCVSNKCEWRNCDNNYDCTVGYCCVDDPNGPKPGTGICVPKGYKSGSYLCDPPEWKTELKETSGIEEKNILELILNFFSQLFNQR